MDIVIVGGGSSGWMTAAYLSARLLGQAPASRHRITVLESEEVPKTGVGEATVDAMRRFLDDCDIQESEFINRCGAGLKHGIQFEGWRADGHPYFHPFERVPRLARERLVEHYLNANRSNVSAGDYNGWVGAQTGLALAMRSPRTFGDRPYDGTFAYGYHLDANAFAHFLKSICLKRGVRHMIAHIEGVETNGLAVLAVVADGGQKVGADLFVDCTGFASKLISAMGARFIDYSDRLAVDRAITCPNKTAPRAPRPFTKSAARKAGWTFDIDVQSRSGRGYVYSSSHISEDAAISEFMSTFPGTVSAEDIRSFRLRVGRLDRSWIGNCVAIGLSAGFLEPLESTGLYFVDYAARAVMDGLGFSVADQSIQTAFNKAFGALFDGTADFIQAHYSLSDRTDTDFWRDVSEEVPLSAGLEELLSLWRLKPPSDSDLAARSGYFTADSWSAILYGLVPNYTTPPVSMAEVSPEDSLKLRDHVLASQKRALKEMPPHADYLKSLRRTSLGSKLRPAQSPLPPGKHFRQR